jgi:nucleoside-diphosphate-sugar epimerase
MRTIAGMNKTIVVTGASGYLGSWIVKLALDAGFTVRGTVRDPDDESKTAHLNALNGAERLSLHKADLLESGAFDDIVAGADVVIHSASPFFTQHVKDGYEQLVKPAVEGTKNVLSAVDKADSVLRVVLTSSVAAVMGDAIEAKDYPGGVIDESRWNESSSVSYQPYSYSKLAAERAAWDMANAQKRWSLVTINPAFIIGPSLSGRIDGTSVSVMKQLGDGTFKQGAPELIFGFVDVRDVARAHVSAVEHEDTTGRFILAERVASFPELAKVLQERYPGFPFPVKKVPKPLFWLLAPTFGLQRRFVARNVGIRYSLDNARSCKELGIEYHDSFDTALEHFGQLIENGVVTAK